MEKTNPRLRCLFMGTPELAVPTLRALLDSPHPVIGVVAQPDRPAGRGLKNHTPPTIELAKQRQIPTYQPEKLRDKDLLATWQSLHPDIVIVIAYGKYLPQEILKLAPQGCINVHFSLLPKYRGAAPINWAIINDEGETGVTTMVVTPEMDAGPILKQKKNRILPEDTAEILGKRLASVGAELLLETLADLQDHRLKPIAQNEREVILAPALKKENGLIPWEQQAATLIKLIHGVTPWPGAYTFLDRSGTGVDKERLKIYSAEAVGQGVHKNPGEILAVTSHGLEIACGHGVLLLTEVQPEGKRRMTIRDYVNGHKVTAGMRFVS